MTRPRHRFCWLCSRQLQSNTKHVIVVGYDGHEHPVHATCAREEGLEIVEPERPRPPRGGEPDPAPSAA